MSIARIDLVTIVFEGDINALRLQAISMRKNLDPVNVGRIFIVVNEMAPENTYALLQKRVIPEYGELISKIEIMPMTRMMRPHVRFSGHRTQRVLKLLASRLVDSSFYIALDAKTHFIKKVTFEDFIDTRGRKARASRSKLKQGPGHSLRLALSYFGAEPLDYELPAFAPFSFNTVFTREMIEAVEGNEQAHFDDVMLAQPDALTEYSFYFAYLLTREGALEATYRFGPRTAAAITSRGPRGPEGVQDLLTGLENGGQLAFGISRKRLAELSQADRGQIAKIWQNGGLFPTVQDGERHIEDLLKEHRL